jgi:hypothetical protein
VKLKYFLIIWFFFLAFASFSQITEEQEELIDTAEDYFFESRFKEAMPLYSQLLSLYPTEPVYSFYYGACLVENNREIDKSIKYLSYAAKKLNNQPLVFYYLGRAYHLSYQFDKAIQQYQEFQAKAGSKQANEKQSDREINICNNGLNLVKYASPLIVLENKKTKESNFQYSYKLDDIGGKLVVKPDQFKTKVDLKRDQKELLFISDSGLVLFSSLGNNKHGDRDIYWANKDANGDFLPSKNIGDVINTSFDEDYPFLKADGKTLYFCSKGHNTMGGFDIFKTEYDSTSNTWSTPENLDFPTNTPYDDLLYVVDANDNLAYFASNRESQEEKLNIYKIQVDHNPVERTVNSVEEIKEIAKLQVTPLADIPDTQDNNTERAVATTEVAEFQDKGPRSDFSFEEVYESNVNSSEAYTSMLRKDIIVLKQGLEDTKAKNTIASNIAHQKLGELRDAKVDLERIESKSDPKALMNNSEYQEKIGYINKINTQAQVAVNVAKKLEKEIKTRERELNITELLLNDSANNSTQELVQNINANRTFLQNNNRTYLSLANSKIEKEKEKEQKNKAVNNQKNRLEKEVQEFNLLLADYDEAEKENNQNEVRILKTEIADSKARVIAENKALKQKERALKKVEEEIKFINQLNGEFSSTENLKLASTNQTLDKALISDNAKALDSEIKNLTNNAETLSIESKFNDITKDILEEVLLAENTTNELENTEAIENSESEITNSTAEDNTNSPTTNNVIDNSENTQTEQAGNIPENSNKPKTISNPNNSLVVNSEPKTNTNNTISKNEMVEVSLVKVQSLEARKLFFEAKRNQQISDSLALMAQEKEQSVNFISNKEQQDIVKNEIEELNQLSRIKSNQAKQAYTKAQESEKQYIADNPVDPIIESFVEKGLMADEHGDDENPEYIEYKKAAFTEHYYRQTISENNTKASMNKGLLNSGNLSSERRTQIEKELNTIDQSTKQANIAIKQAQEVQLAMRNKLADNIDVLPQTKEEILAASTNTKLSSNIKVDKAYIKSSKNIIKKRENAQKETSKYRRNLEVLKFLEDSLSLSEDVDLREEISFEIEGVKEEAWENFLKANELKQFSNMEEKNTLKSLLDINRKYASSDLVTKAYLYEKESEVLEEKANFIRNNNKASGTFRSATIEELEKANLYEITANNRKKAALEIYASIPDDTNPELIAENTNDKPNSNIKAKDDIEDSKPVSELLPDEEERLAEYKKLYAKVDDKKIRAQNNHRELNEEKITLERTYLAKDKKKQQAKVDKLEIETKNAYQLAYRTELIANKKKRDLYQEKIKASIKNSDNKDNKAIAKQYVLDADFYFEEAAKIVADSTASIFDLKAQHKQRLSLEKQALEAQELAFSALNRTSTDFLTSSGFVKIEPIEQNQKPVDPDIVHKVQTQRILDKIGIESSEAKRLAKTDKLIDQKAKLEKEYLENKAQVDLLSDSLNRVTDPKVWKKLDNQISKLEEKSLSYLFNIAATSEPIHYDRYMIYKDRVRDYRIKDKSERAVNGRTLEKEANKAFRRAQNLRSRSFEVVSVDRAYDMLQEAQELEVVALDKMEKAYTIYLDLKPIEEDVAKYIAENTDTNTVDQLGYNVIESEGDVEAYETPEYIEPEDIEVVPVLSNDTTQVLLAENMDSLMTPIEADTLKAEQNTPIDTIPIESKEIEIEEPAENIEFIAEDSLPKDSLSIEEVNALIAEVSNNNEPTLSENTTEDSTKNPTESTIEDSSDETTGETTEKILAETPETIPLENNESLNENNTEENYTNTNQEPDNKNITKASSNDIINEAPIVSNNTETIVYDISNGQPAFKMLTTPAYSETKPIPIDRPLPNGIVYKIQIGAFTKPIPQNSFRGLTPITGETRQNSKYVRYFVGLFDTYEAADAVLPHIQRTGYRDAFIVAYRNGERIAVYIAKREDSREQDYQNLAQAETQRVLKIVNENAEQTLGKTATEALEPLNPSVNLTEISSTMYTVQIGVYKRHVAHERLYNLAPLYNDLTKSGLIRYTVGQFVDYNEAIQKRNEIRTKGIRDAFVTAYRNGERISIRTARQELANITNEPTNTSTTEDITTPTISNEETNETVGETAKTPTITSPSFNAEKLHYCVQIGAFSNSVPVSTVSSFVQLSKLDELGHFQTSTGQTVYTIGKFESLSRANLLKQDLIEQGITDAFIIAYDGEKKVPISEAQKILKP